MVLRVETFWMGICMVIGSVWAASGDMGLAVFWMAIGLFIGVADYIQIKRNARGTE